MVCDPQHDEVFKDIPLLRALNYKYEVFFQIVEQCYNTSQETSSSEAHATISFMKSFHGGCNATMGQLKWRTLLCPDWPYEAFSKEKSWHLLLVLLRLFLFNVCSSPNKDKSL